MDPVVECVPNISEGRNPNTIKEVTDAIEAVADVRLLDVDPDDGPARAYLERCKDFAADPPPADWDGVWEMMTK